MDISCSGNYIRSRHMTRHGMNIPNENSKGMEKRNVEIRNMMHRQVKKKISRLEDKKRSTTRCEREKATERIKSSIGDEQEGEEDHFSGEEGKGISSHKGSSSLLQDTKRENWCLWVIASVKSLQVSLLLLCYNCILFCSKLSPALCRNTTQHRHTLSLSKYTHGDSVLLSSNVRFPLVTSLSRPKLCLPALLVLSKYTLNESFKLMRSEKMETNYTRENWSCSTHQAVRLQLSKRSTVFLSFSSREQLKQRDCNQNNHFHSSIKKISFKRVW